MYVCRCSYVIILCVQGFDAWQCPENITEMGLIKTLLVSKEGLPDEYEKFNQLSQLALDQYNDQQLFPCVCEREREFSISSSFVGFSFSLLGLTSCFCSREQIFNLSRSLRQMWNFLEVVFTTSPSRLRIQLVVLLRISKHE